ncbi:MAG: phage tail tube protein [Candidatus Heimdallarchaeaceae archaeon]
MASVGIKRFTINNVTIQTKTGTAEYLPSSSEKTPILDDGSGEVMFTTQEKKAGSIKVEVSTLKSADTARLRDLEDAEMVLELVDGTTVVGTGMTQTDNNAVTAADGVAGYMFQGNVVLR